MRTRTSAARPPVSSPVVTYRATRLPSGRLMPIEVRIGRRLLRTIPAESNEGQRLLGSNRVEIVEIKGRSSVRPTIVAGGSVAPAQPAGAAAARRSRPVREH